MMAEKRLEEREGLMLEKPQCHLIVVIARAKGSGGGLIGKRLAKRLGCRYLDREILVEAARRMSKEPKALEAFDERRMSFWERTMALTVGSPEAPYVPPPIYLDDGDLFITESAIMREAARRGPVVIVGRAGFAVLRGEPGLLSVFLHAPLEKRVKRVMKVYGALSVDEARELVLRTDRDRNHFVKSVLGIERLDSQNYHLCIDTGRFGTSGAGDLIYQAVQNVAKALGGPATAPKR